MENCRLMDITDKLKIQGRQIKHNLSLFSILKGSYSSSIPRSVSTYNNKMNITKYKTMKIKTIIKKKKLHSSQMSLNNKHLKAFLLQF